MSVSSLHLKGCCRLALKTALLTYNLAWRRVGRRESQVGVQREYGLCAAQGSPAPVLAKVMLTAGTIASGIFGWKACCNIRHFLRLLLVRVPDRQESCREATREAICVLVCAQFLWRFCWRLQ